MGKYSAEQYVNDLREEYGKAMTLVSNIGKTLQEYMKSKGKNFSAEIFCKQFDCILQYSMLQMAVADGDVSENEITVIKNITAFGDLVEYINSKYTTSVSWNDILNARTQSVKDWLARNEKFIDVLSKEFELGFAVVDGAVEREDMLDVLCKATGALMGLVSGADGSSTDKEKEAARNCYFIKTIAGIEAKLRG